MSAETETTAQKVIGLADLAAEAIRGINHGTIIQGTFEQPGDIHSTISNLAVMARRLPQAIHQLTVELLRLENEGRVRHDDGVISGPAVQMAADLLSQAKEDTESLAKMLNLASEIMSHLGTED